MEQDIKKYSYGAYVSKNIKPKIIENILKDLKDANITVELKEYSKNKDVIEGLLTNDEIEILLQIFSNHGINNYYLPLY